MGNPNFDAVLSTTLASYRKTIENNIFNAMPLLFWMKKKKRKTILDGGSKIIVPILYGKNETVKSYSGYEILDVTPQEGITAAEFNWKQVAGSITISREEERKNSGESRIVNLLNSKMVQCQMSLQDSLSQMLFGDGTGNGGKDILGLSAIVANTPTSGVLGGIDRATNTWWRNRYTTAPKDTTAFDTLIGKMRTMYNTASKGSDVPDFIISDQSSFEGYEGQLAQLQRFTDAKTASAGFENLKFKNAVCMFDIAAPADAAHGNMYFLNSKYLTWTVDKETDFKTTTFIRPENQDAKTAQILFMGNLVVSNCSRLGIVKEIDLE